MKELFKEAFLLNGLNFYAKSYNITLKKDMI